MANQSIYAAFERMWQHIIAKMEAKSAAHVEYTDRAIQNAWADVDSHISNTSNPHEVTATQVGALPLSGGVMTGEITMANDKYYQFESGASVYCKAGSVSNTLYLNPASNTSYRGIKIGSFLLAPNGIDGQVSLGDRYTRFNNLYLSGSLSNGTNAVDINEIVTAIESIPATTENWTFTLEDGTTVTKKVYIG